MDYRWGGGECLLFGKLLNGVLPKHIIMHRNPMPLTRFRQVSVLRDSLIEHATCSNCEDSDTSSISQYLLHRRLPNFATYNSLSKTKSCL